MTSPDTIARLPDGGRFVALDSLRGLAALWVAAFHVNGGGPLLRSTFIANGWLMVDFFFVLSGFVMAAAYRDTMAGGMSLRRYAILRLGRVYPLHAAVLGAYLAFELGLWAFGSSASPHVAFSGDHSPGSLLLMAALLQGFAWPELTGWNTQSWSIAVEAWLYLAIALLWRRFGARVWALVLPVSLICLALLTLDFQGWMPLLTAQVARGVAGFGIGVACWQAFERTRGRLPISPTLATGAEITVIILGITLFIQPFQPALFEPAYALFAAAMLVFAREGGAVSRLLRTAPFMLAGTLSYSIYMVHLLVLRWGSTLLVPLGLGEVRVENGAIVRTVAGSGWAADASGLILAAMCVAVAWISWRLVEWPARRWSRRYAATIGAERAEAAAPTM